MDGDDLIVSGSWFHTRAEKDLLPQREEVLGWWSIMSLLERSPVYAKDG